MREGEKERRRERESQRASDLKMTLQIAMKTKGPLAHTWKAAWNSSRWSRPSLFTSSFSNAFCSTTNHVSSAHLGASASAHSGAHLGKLHLQRLKLVLLSNQIRVQVAHMHIELRELLGRHPLGVCGNHSQRFRAPQMVMLPQLVQIEQQYQHETTRGELSA
eukprot:218438-Rhodomonas_salina.1